MGIGKLGRKPAVYNPFTPKLARYMVETVPSVPSIDYTTEITIPWQMLCNDTIGCCTISAIGHLVMGYSSLLDDIQLQMMTPDEVQTYYKILGNWNPNDPATDNGCTMTTVLNYWMGTGIRIGTILNKIYGYAYLDPKNVNIMRYSLSEYGGLYIGFQLPQYCEDNDYWKIDPNMGVILGGHCVTLQGVDDNNDFVGISWGKKVTLSADFIATYCDECYMIYNEHFVNPKGIDATKLQSDMVKLRNKTLV